MMHLRYLALQIFFFCYNIEASSNKNVLIFKVMAAETLEEAATYKVKVNLTTSPHETETKFLSVAISSKSVAINWMRSEKLRNLASALSPSEIRLGGSSADFLQFSPSATEYQTDDPGQFSDDSYKFDSGDFYVRKEFENYTVTGQQWERFISFISQSGWELLFDVNLFWWRSDGLWNSTNAELLLNYSSARGLHIPYFQLGNEVSSYWHKFSLTITPETYLEDLRILKNLTAKYPLYASSKLCGPDVTDLSRSFNSKQFLKKFIAAGAYDVVNEISLHHYYLDGEIATAADFLSVSTLDSLRDLFDIAVEIARSSPRPLPIRLTETSSCFGGGAQDLSDRYVAGFLWLDKLGMAAQCGITRVFRQTFLGSAYGLVTSGFDPNPDYYLSVLFKRLIEGPVFSTSLDLSNQNLRIYAQCARRGLYSAGALVVYYLNVGNTEAVVSLPQFQGADLDLYLLTQGDADGLQSKFVKLNGQTLLMSESVLPALPPKPHNGDVTVAAQSFGFIVVPHANVALCVNYYTAVDSRKN